MTKIIIPDGTRVIIEGKPATTNGAWEVYADYGDQREIKPRACTWETECTHSEAMEHCLLPEGHQGRHVHYCGYENAGVWSAR